MKAEKPMDRVGLLPNLFSVVTKAIACLSFVVGGVSLFGNHWETKL